MTTANDQPPDCPAVRDELPALLYDDLDTDSKRRVERHLESCSECRAELESHRRTMQLLDSWSVDTDRVATWADRERSRRGVMLAWLRPMSIGAAAALIVFAALGFVGTDVHYAQGQLAITFGRGSAPTSNRIVDPESITPMLRAVAREEMDGRYDAYLETLEAGLAEFAQDQEQRRLWLVSAIDLRRHQDQRQQAAVLQALADHLQNEAVQTHQAIDDLRSWVAMNDQSLQFENELNRKE